MSLTYDAFLKKKIDLTPLGIEISNNFPPYFCTPKGAEIFGSAGVDGIHFCFIRGFGEMVFAVSPSNEVGEYVHPIARTFEELLSLLVSTSDIFAVEQAWAWDQNRFCQFLRENPATEEQEQIMRILEHDLSVPFMEAPFDYIKKLQTTFDYSRIEFTDEYYDVVGAFEPIEKPKEWKVFYGGGYWGSGSDGSDCRIELPLNSVFTWGDEIWHIPAVYMCNRGFVVDYCVEIDLDRVKEYCQKWISIQNRDSGKEEAMCQINCENPFDLKAMSHVMQNGKSVREESGCGIFFIPEWCLPNGFENPIESIDILRHYHLDETKAWAFTRHAFRRTTKKPQNMKSLSVRLERLPEVIQGIQFKNPSVGDVITFTHPISGTKHKLTVLSCEQQELSENAFVHEEYTYPRYHTAMVYTLEPPLPGEVVTVRDCLENEHPKRIPQKQHESKATCDNVIGTIGGADGPMAMMITSKNQDGKFYTALSALHFEPTADVEWKMEFSEKMVDDVEITLL